MHARLSTTRRFAIGLTGLAIGASVLFATRVQALEPPTGRVVLTIEGAIAHTNQGSKAQFDMEMLERLPQQLQLRWAREPRRHPSGISLR